MNNSNNTADKKTAYNSTFAIGGVSCSASTLVVEIPPIVNLQNVVRHCNEPHNRKETDRKNEK
jgi:hypothetical protein